MGDKHYRQDGFKFICEPEFVDSLQSVYSTGSWVYDWVQSQQSHGVLRGRQPVRTGTLGNKKMIVKRLFHGGAFAKLTGDRFLSISRLIGSLNVSRFLRNNDVLTPLTMFVTWNRSGLFYRCEMGVELIENSIDASDYFFSDRHEKVPHKTDSVAMDLGRQVAQLHKLHFIHPDLNLMNFVLDRNRIPYIIDLDKAVLPAKPLTANQKQSNINRLKRSIRKQGQCFQQETVDRIIDFLEKGYQGAL